MSQVAWATSVRWFAHLLVLGSLPGVPSVASGQRAVGIGWVADTIPSRALGQRTVYVATPEGYDDGTSRYPLLVLLDADFRSSFQLWIAQATFLAEFSTGVPRVIVVGIPNGRDRIHDMTPPATGSWVQRFPTAGGAAAFADFVIDEVLPHVRARYRTLPSVTLAGWSAAGLFALDVAARRPGAFQGIIAMDASLQFNDATLVDTYAALLRRARSRPRLFVSIRGIEESVATEAGRRFAQVLNASLGGASSYRVYPDATHQLVQASFGDGLQFIFDPVSPRHLAIARLDVTKADAAALDAALRSSAITYATATRSLGLPEALPEEMLNDLGYELMEHHKAALAVSVFQQNVNAYPHSPNAYDSLADGFLAVADTAAALTQLRTAVKVSHSVGVPVHPETRRKLELLQTRK